MSRALIPMLQVNSSQRVQRIRELPVPGEILPSIGDAVVGGDIVARAELPGEIKILRIAEKMGIQAFEVVERLQVAVGDTISTGQVLCEHAGLFGFFRTTYESPCDGVVEVLSQETGHVALRLASTQLEVNGYLDGNVVEIEPGKSLTIESQAAFVQGVFGIGGERRGTLHVLDIPIDKSPVESDLQGLAKGDIVVGGAKPSLAVLQAAAQAGAVGFVTGAIDDTVLKGYLGYDLGIALTGDEDVPMTVIVTEGFGDIALSQRTYELLKKLHGKGAAISGATQVRAGALRPEIIVPHGDSKEFHAVDAAEQPLGLETGLTVRIIRVPYFGMQGKVVSLPAKAQKIETGARTRVVEVELENGEKVFVPRVNVELCG